MYEIKCVGYIGRKVYKTRLTVDIMKSLCS